MFRHKGKGRTYSHNLKLASVLSCVAGVVNITGVLSVGTLTTNVTGHFAVFSEQLFLEHLKTAFISIVYVLFFLAGAFTSGFLMEKISIHKYYLTYILPISIEASLLFSAGLFYLLFPADVLKFPILISNALLFAMGLQNALVTKISQSVVRTTHLTGLFTDLGIELSQFFIHKKEEDQKKLRRSIQLKLIIIFCFFMGGILGGFLYMHFKLSTLLFPAGLLLFLLWYDRLLFRYYHLKRSLRE